VVIFTEIFENEFVTERGTLVKSYNLIDTARYSANGVRECN